MTEAPQKTRLAAVDIGTNSFHLIIADVEGSSANFKILGREKEIVRLGTGSSDMKFLTEDAITRGISTLKRFKGLADAAGAPLRAIATSAVREAINQNEFIKRAYDEAGVKVEIASGFEEARFIYLGVLQALPVFDKKILLIDIGGGSTEFLIGQKREVFYDNSIKLGAIRLTQRFFNSDRTESKAVKECRKFIKGTMNPVKRQLENINFDTAVGSSGTIVNIANMIRIAKTGEPEGRLNNFTLTKEELYEITEKIIEAKTEKQILKIPGLDPSRADIITAGALILEQIFKELKIKQLTVSDFALREGIILDTIETRLALKEHDHLTDIRYKSVIQLAENFKYEKEHSDHTSILALKIFDQTKDIHKLGNLEREYLEAASILHEVGCFVSHSQHHRHSYYLIRNSELLGFTENEKEIIANIARYHRKSHPRQKHETFAKLNPQDQTIVKKLASILRIADGLDRTHASAVNNVNCINVNGELNIVLEKSPYGNTNLELEIWGAENKKALFEETFGVKVKFEVGENIGS
jgi:exopolyphosphatase/guanosine-5'-triphosphate,3'-diphosphate pyrophosphatase